MPFVSLLEHLALQRRVAFIEAKLRQFLSAAAVNEVALTAATTGDISDAVDAAVAPLASTSYVDGSVSGLATTSSVTSGLAAKQDASGAWNDGNGTAKVTAALPTSLPASGASVTVDWGDVPGGGFSGTSEYPIEA